MPNRRVIPPHVPMPKALCRGANQWVKGKIRFGNGRYMTPRQRDVYLYIKYFLREHAYSPTYKEIAYGLGMKSRSNTMRIVHRLNEMGAVLMETKRHRTVRGNYRLDRNV